VRNSDAGRIARKRSRPDDPKRIVARSWVEPIVDIQASMWVRWMAVIRDHHRQSIYRHAEAFFIGGWGPLA
jgi:hypothetical protein